MNTIRSEMRRYTPALALDRLMPRRIRVRVLRYVGIVEVLIGAYLLGLVLYTSVTGGGFTTAPLLEDARFLTGAFLIFLGPFCVLLQLSYFYNTLYFRGLQSVHGEDFADDEGVTMEAGQVCVEGMYDLTMGFLTSPYARESMFRLGIFQADIDAYLRSSRTALLPDVVQLKPGAFLALHDIGELLFELDQSFSAFLFSHGVTKELFHGANEWVSRVRMLHKNYIRWWSRDNLGKIKGVGRELSFGVAYELKRYMRDINTTSSFSLFINDSAYANEVIAKIEATLARSKAANVMLVGDPGVGKMDMLIELGRRMKEGQSVESLTAKRMVVFDTDAFVATHNSKNEFESAFLTLMAQTERAGNIILVIEQFNAFTQNVVALGVNVGELLDRFLNSPNVQVVATVDPGGYHQTVEMNQQLLQYFNPVIIDKPDLSSVIRVLEETTWNFEHDHHVFFTYQAIARVAESADQYIVEGVMPDKAVSLLSEVASRGQQENIKLITEEFVDSCVQAKTGIPIGPVAEKERDLLVNLEDVLHKRVVGQHDAIVAIASAMRRARAGIQSKDRPISSFLFLGSTGVGKTETAKALAFTFFGAEDTMLRFDMSEFSDVDGLSRLIGTSTHPGALSSALREHPYRVVLLDEFEKSSEPVRDLFLQILDEGLFTDARGTQINARNCIFIATSNAGSDMIFELVRNGKKPAEFKDVIIDAIINRGVYRPELINRFDAVVLFESLGETEQRQIARLMLEDLQNRMKAQGYELIVDDMLVDVLMQKGFDPEFGARPMRRAIQDIVEERIARKIIAEGLRRGDSIRFVPEDFG